MPDTLHPTVTRSFAQKRRGFAPSADAAFLAFSHQVFAGGSLSAKMKQIIAVAVAHVTQCPYCIKGHTAAALRHGASPEELMEAIWVAAEMRAGASYAHSMLAIAEIDKFGEPIEMPGFAARAGRISMPIDLTNEVTREAVGIFHEPDQLQNAIDELLSSGFHRAQLSLLASERAVVEKLGHRYQRVHDLADDPATPRAAYVSTEAIGDAEGALIGGLMYVGATVATGAIVVSGGTLAAVIAAAALAGGAGGLIGSVLAKWVGSHHAHYLQEQIQHGGLLLWVRTWTAEAERRAVEILKKYAAENVHLHGAAATLSRP